MEVFNQDWEHQWNAFKSAPYIIAPFVSVAGFIGWWLKGIKSDNIINGLNGRIIVFEDRLTLAAEKVEAASLLGAQPNRAQGAAWRSRITRPVLGSSLLTVCKQGNSAPAGEPRRSSHSREL